MEINITNKNGIILKTANTYVEEDINVTIDGSLLPSGSMDITENGTYDVTSVESAVVNVPIPDGYIQPSGALEITENNTYDVTEKASVVVNVPSAEVLPLYEGSTRVPTYTIIFEQNSSSEYDVPGYLQYSIDGGNTFVDLDTVPTSVETLESIVFQCTTYGNFIISIYDHKGVEVETILFGSGGGNVIVIEEDTTFSISIVYANQGGGGSN